MADPTSITIKGKELQLVTLDFETYYSQDFTLSGKMNMSEYVRDERFKAHGVSIKIGAQPTYWVRDRDIASELAKIKWDESALICHNTQFDGFIMSHHYGIVPAFYIDTLSMARGVLGHSTFHNLDTVAKMFGLAGKAKVGALLDTKGKYDLTDDEMEALGAYALDDVDDTEAIFHRMYPYLSDKELRLIDLTIRMFCDPILEVDIGRVHAEYVREGSLKDDSVKRAGVDPSDLSSNIKFAALLKARGVEPPMKESPTTGKQTYAFAKGDLDFQALLQHKDPQVRSLCEARLRIKSSIGETRAQRFMNAGDNGWKLPVALNYSGAHTHRWCMPPESEVLTKEGWVRMDEWAGQNIMQWSEDGAMSWSPTVMNEFPFQGVLKTIDSCHISGAFTDDHVIPRWTSGMAFKSDTAEETYGKNIRVPVTGVLSNRSGIKLSDSEIRLWVAIQGDGSIESTSRPIRFKFRKERKLIRLREILTEAGIQFSEFKCKVEHTVSIPRKHVRPWMWGAKSFGSEILKLSQHQREIFLGELRYWDGSVKSDYTHFTTTDKKAAEWVATLASISGIAANICKSARAKPQKDKFTVTLRDRRYANVQAKYWGEREYSGKVFCPTVSTGFFLVRSNGKIFVTGNSGGNKMNLQNLPRGGELRLSILAPEGMHVVVADSAQIEARTLAWLAGQEDIISAFAKGEDVYKLMATKIYPVDLKNVDKDQRFIGKLCVLGLGYGMGAAKLQHTLAAGIMGPPVEFSLEECQRSVNIYRSANYAIKDLWAMGDRIITDMSLGTSGSYGPLEWGAGFIRLPNGMFLQYPDLECEYYETSSGLQRTETTYRSRSGRTKLYGGILIENIVQALARIIVAEQMLECADITRVVTTTHDEIVAVHSICEAPKILERMIDIMSTPLEWCQDLPLSAEGGHARNYSK